ncbi:hypothetical protein NTGHW29_120039 [Candidatus Nitrotoga sp. HW29]|nr:hypothetical protein NTGHW29_120039 [Candidatus Nitrotoga sp. HW29]
MRAKFMCNIHDKKLNAIDLRDLLMNSKNAIVKLIHTTPV